MHFIEDFIEDLKDLVEEVRTTGKINGAINSTLLVLIPKKKGVLTFDDFRPISLCNTIYKLVSKIIADRLKGILSNFITPEQYGFKKNRNIHDVVAVTQETIHTIHSKKLEAAVMKIDLKKVYDRVDWVFFRLVLFKIGLSREAVAWIMACVTNTYLVVIINGSVSKFLNPVEG